MYKRFFCLFLTIAILASNAIFVSASALPFTDVPEDHVYRDAIEYVYTENIMNGVSSTEFGCNSFLNRAMLVTILYRMSECYELIEPEGFTDVPEDSFCYYAVGWAQYYGIVNGYNETTFAPTELITTQQLAIFLYRYADIYECKSFSLPEPDIIEHFADYASINPVAHDAANWAVNCGIMSSTYTYFQPDKLVRRAVCANYLYRFATLAYGDAKVLASADFEKNWYGDTISDLLEDYGCDATVQTRLTPTAMEFAFYNNDIVYVTCHGMDEYIVLEGGNLYYHDIEPYSMIEYELAYIGACLAGGTFTQHLSEVAYVNYAVGFTDTVSVHPSYLDWGANKFDRLFFEYYTDPELGGNVSSAINYAKSQFSEYDLIHLGLSSVTIYH